MKPFQTMCRAFLPILLLLTLLTAHANAALQAAGPIDPVTTIPSFYQDTANLALMPCLDQNGFCILPPPFDTLSVPMSPITTTGPINDANLPGEGFYYSADALLPIEAGELARLTFVLEYAFLGGVIPTTGTTFLRTDLQKMRNLAPNSTYRVTHPYGTFEFTTDGAGATTGGGGVAVRQEDGTGTTADYLPPLMKSANTTKIGPFLTRAVGGFVVDPVSGHTYIGDAVTPVAVHGSPTGNNFYRIERLDAGGGVAATWETNLFVLMGRVFTGQIPSAMSIDRATYARDASSEQIDLFATALPTAVLNLTGNGITSTNLTQDIAPNTTKFFTHIPLASTTLPTLLNVTNSLDIPPIDYPVTLVDEVNITQAFYNPVSRAVTVKAASRDKLAPLPTLTVPQFAAPNTLDATGTLVKTLPPNAIPPMTVTVNSSKLGTATAFVSVVVPPPPPVAVADAATTPGDTAVVINVLGNDTTTGTLDPATVVTAAPVSGTAVANPANGTVTFTPTAGFTGAASFTYTVKDILGQVSNSATVSVTVTSSVVQPATAVTLFSTIATPQVAGTAVSFNAAATGGSGNYEYQYWLRDTSGVYSLVKPFSAASTWNWNTTGLVAGSYWIAIQARSVGSTSPNGFDAENVKEFFIIANTGPVVPATAVNITANLPSPQASGAPVTFTGTASGGSGFYEYRFWLKDTNGVYTLVQPFSTNPSWSWNSTGALIGTYTIAVQARSVGSNPLSGFDVENTVFFDIQ